MNKYKFLYLKAVCLSLPVLNASVLHFIYIYIYISDYYQFAYPFTSNSYSNDFLALKDYIHVLFLRLPEEYCDLKNKKVNSKTCHSCPNVPIYTLMLNVK